MTTTIITKVPGFKGQEFTETSKTKLSLPEAIKFTRERNSTLVSLAEAAALIIETGEKQGELRTRTCAVYFRQGLEYYLAFDDETDTNKNILLARASEGYAEHKKGRLWTLPISDPHISQILQRAEKTERILVIPKYEPKDLRECLKYERFLQTSMDKESPLELKTEIDDITQKSPLALKGKAPLGQAAEPLAAHLRGKKQDTLLLYVLQPTFIKTKMSDGQAIVFSTTINRNNAEITALETFGGKNSYFGDGAYGGQAIGRIRV